MSGKLNFMSNYDQWKYSLFEKVAKESFSDIVEARRRIVDEDEYMSAYNVGFSVEEAYDSYLAIKSKEGNNDAISFYSSLD